MHYVVSDIHGCLKEFKILLDTLKFSDSDVLYVLGDCTDRGPDPVGVLELMSLHDNMIPIMGNHDFMAASVLPGLFTEITDESIEKVLTDDFLSACEEWRRNGGDTTIEEFRSLDADDRQFYMDYLEDFSFYETVFVNDKEYLLIHSLPDGCEGGTAGEKQRNPFAAESISQLNGKNLAGSYTIEEIIFGRPAFFGNWKQETIIITGHTPTVKLGPEFAGKIYHKDNFYDIDCGCVTGHRLGALCLETGEEFYTDSLDKYWTGKRRPET